MRRRMGSLVLGLFLRDLEDVFLGRLAREGCREILFCFLLFVQIL